MIRRIEQDTASAWEGSIDSAIPGRVRFRLGGAADLGSARERLQAADASLAALITLTQGVRSRRFLATFAPDPVLMGFLMAALGLRARGRERRRPRRVLRPRRERTGAISRLPLRALAKETLGFVLSKALVPPVLQPWFTAWAIAPFLWRGVQSLGTGRIGADALDGIALAASFATRQYGSAGTVAFLLKIGHIIEDSTREEARASLARLFGPGEDAVWIERDGQPVRVTPADLVVGDRVIVRAGHQIPVDGVVADGEAMVNQACMTGEALPIARRVGATVFAGTAVEEGRLVVVASGVGDDTRCAGIVRLLQQAERNKATVQTRAAQLADHVAPLTLLLSGIVYALTGDPIKAVSVLVVDYSCAIKLAGPLAVNAALLEAAHHGALIRGGRFLERLSEVDSVVLDKTGTLTKAEPAVVEVEAFEPWDRDYVLRHAACLEEHFPHPVARAVVRRAEEEELHHEEKHSEVEYIVAHGIASSLDGERILVGSQHFVGDDEGVDLAASAARVSEWGERGLSTLYVAIGGRLAGLLAISDPVHPDAPGFIASLRAAGFSSPLMITGDGERSARSVAHTLGIDSYRSQVLPDEKIKIVEELRAQGRKVIMLGDGMNDSAAISAADVGVSLDHGADLAKQAADVLLLEGRLPALLDARRIANGMARRIRVQSAAIIGSNTAFLVMGLLGAPAPLLALLHNATTVGAALLALRPYLTEAEGAPR